MNQLLGCGLRRALTIASFCAMWLASQFACAPASTAPAATETAATLAARIAPEVFFANPNIREAVLSPSGKQLAVTAKRGQDAQVRESLFVIHLDRPDKVVPVGVFTDADVGNVHWVNESRIVFSATDYSAGSGRPDAAPGLFAVNPDGSHMRMLVSRKGRRFVVSSDAKYTALPWNHRLLSVPAFREGQPNDVIVVGEMRFNKSREIERLPALRLNVNTGDTEPIQTNAPRSTYRWLFDSNGEPRVAISKDENLIGIHWRSPGQNDWKLLSQADILLQPFSPRHVDDAGNLLVTQALGPDATEVLSRFDFAANAPAKNALVRIPGFDFKGSLIDGKAGGPVLGVRVSADAETTVWFDKAMRDMQALADVKLPGRVNQLSCERCGESDMTVMVRSHTDRQPGELWVYRKASGQWQRLFRVMNGIDERLMASVNLHRIKARDGRDLPVWITRPNGLGDVVDGADKPIAGPAVLLVHGGPWLRGGYWRWEAMAQFLASRGYTVIEPEFRGSTGYGYTHEKAGYKQWGQTMQDDVADALLWAQKAGLANGRACVMGGSYGGYSSLMGLARHPDLYRCAVSFAAVTDLELFVAGSWWVNDDVGDTGRSYVLPELVGDPKREADMLRANSPIHVADRIKAPVLMAFGEEDLRVPLVHGTRMREALTKSGNPPIWVTYPGEGHGGWLPKTNVDFAKRVEVFLGQHLK